MKKQTGILLLAICFCVSTFAQRQMEYLNRGVVAVPDGKGNIFVSWRLLVTDEDNIAFNIYRSANNEPAVKLNKKPVDAVTHFNDEKIDSTKAYTYYITPVTKGKE